MWVLTATQFSFETRWSLQRHAHTQFHELIIILNGAIETILDGSAPVIGRAGESLLYPRGTLHGERSIGDGPLKMVCIAFKTRNWISDPIHSSDIQGRVRLLGHWMTELFPLSSDGDQQTLNALIVAILAERSRSQSEDGLVQAVRRYVAGRLAQSITLGELADHCSLSRYHFARRFRAASGLSPMAFVRRQRVEAARALIMTTPVMPLRWIARTVGLVDEFHLSRVYRRETGVPPTAARNNSTGRD